MASEAELVMKLSTAFLIINSSFQGFVFFTERLADAPQMPFVGGLLGEVMAVIAALGFAMIAFIGSWHLWKWIFNDALKAQSPHGGEIHE